MKWISIHRFKEKRNIKRIIIRNFPWRYKSLSSVIIFACSSCLFQKKKKKLKFVIELYRHFTFFFLFLSKLLSSLPNGFESYGTCSFLRLFNSIPLFIFVAYTPQPHCFSFVYKYLAKSHSFIFRIPNKGVNRYTWVRLYK